MIRSAAGFDWARLAGPARIRESEAINKVAVFFMALIFLNRLEESQPAAGRGLPSLIVSNMTIQT
jgi:hypothetical protein